MRFGISVFRWIGYLIIGALLGVLFSMFRSYFIVVAMLVLILLPFLSVVTFLWTVKKTDISIASQVALLTEDEETDIVISSKNDGFFPLPGVEAKLSLGNEFFGTASEINISVPLKKGGDKLAIPVKITDIGKYLIRIEDARVYDWTGLVFIRIGITNDTERSKLAVVKALPVKTYRQKQDISGLEAGAVEAEETVRKGSDTSEVNEIREYMEGDRIRDVHWKLSAKTEELMVKVRSSMSGTDIVVALNFYGDADKTRHIIRYSYGLLNQMLALESGLRLLVYNASKTGFDEYVIADESTLMQAYAFIFNTPLESYTGTAVSEDVLREYINRIYPYLDSYVRIDIGADGVGASIIK